MQWFNKMRISRFKNLTQAASWYIKLMLKWQQSHCIISISIYLLNHIREARMKARTDTHHKGQAPYHFDN